jgi:hypothetical protein
LIPVWRVAAFRAGLAASIVTTVIIAHTAPANASFLKCPPDHPMLAHAPAYLAMVIKVPHGKDWLSLRVDCLYKPDDPYAEQRGGNTVLVPYALKGKNCEFKSQAGIVESLINDGQSMIHWCRIKPGNMQTCEVRCEN